MPVDPLQALQGAQRPVAGAAALPPVLVAGAAGALGSEVVRRLVGTQRIGAAHVLVREPLQSGLRGVAGHVVQDGAEGQRGPAIDAWPPLAAGIGLVLFDPPRMFFDRERALWVPRPEELLPVARWMRRSGVHTLAVVLPHVQGRLPEAVKRGLANLDEHAVAALGFERLLILRSAQKPEAARALSPPQRLAAWMLSVFRFMVPASEQPVRASKVAELLDWALRLAPPGIHVAAPETVWQASQGDVREVAVRWLHGSRPAAAA